jgi:hypothetical protein
MDHATEEAQITVQGVLGRGIKNKASDDKIAGHVGTRNAFVRTGRLAVRTIRLGHPEAEALALAALVWGRAHG